LAVRAFYERLGFGAEGPVFDEEGIAHVRMRRPLG
jgi:predicted GNAT family N-acyltransferase